MPTYHRYFPPGQLEFITSSTYHRVRLFCCARFCKIFVGTLQQLRQETGFLLNGWVLMPDHFHLLIRPEPASATARFMQELKKRTAEQIIKVLTRNEDNFRCQQLLSQMSLPPGVHNGCRYRVWQRRYVPFNVFTHKKHMEKLDYMHSNPVTARLAASPRQWAWSSFRYYSLEDSSLLTMDRVR